MKLRQRAGISWQPGQRAAGGRATHADHGELLALEVRYDGDHLPLRLELHVLAAQERALHLGIRARIGGLYRHRARRGVALGDGTLAPVGQQQTPESTGASERCRSSW